MKKYFAMQRQAGLALTVLMTILALVCGVEFYSVLGIVIGIWLMRSKEIIIYTPREIETLNSEEP